MICKIYYTKPIQGSVSHVFKIDNKKQWQSWMDWQTYGVQPPRKITKIEVYEDELPLYLIQWGVRHECYIVLMSKLETPDTYTTPQYEEVDNNMYNKLDYDDVLAAESAAYDAYEALNDWIDRIEHADEDWEKHQKELEAEKKEKAEKETKIQTA